MDSSIRLKQNIKYFTLFSLFSGKLFLATTQVLYFSYRGFDFAEIMLLSSITQIVCLVLEIPSGMIADYIGNKKCLELGMFFAIIANLVAINAKNILIAILYSLLCAVQESLLSGADQAYLFNLLAKNNNEKNFKDTIRIINSKRMTFIALITLLSGVVYKISPYMPFLITTTFYILAFITVALLEDDHNDIKGDVLLKDYIYAVIDYLKSESSVIWLLLLNMCYTFLFMNQNVLLQQYLTDIKIPIVTYGLVFFSFNMVSSYFSKIGEKIELVLGKNTKMVCTFLMVICLIGAGITASVYSLFLLACCRGIVAVINPILVANINNSITDNGKRATILSFYNAASEIPDSIASPLLGHYIDIAGIFSGYVVFGVVGLIPIGISAIIDK